MLSTEWHEELGSWFREVRVGQKEVASRRVWPQTETYGWLRGKETNQHTFLNRRAISDSQSS